MKSTGHACLLSFKSTKWQSNYASNTVALVVSRFLSAQNAAQDKGSQCQRAAPSPRPQFRSESSFDIYCNQACNRFHCGRTRPLESRGYEEDSSKAACLLLAILSRCLSRTFGFAARKPAGGASRRTGHPVSRALYGMRLKVTQGTFCIREVRAEEAGRRSW